MQESATTSPNSENISLVWDAGGRLIDRRLNSGQSATQTWHEDDSLQQRVSLYNAATLSSHCYTLAH